MSQSPGERLAKRMAEATFDKTTPSAVENASRNLPYLTRTMADLPTDLRDDDTAVVVAAGPSLHRRDQLTQLREYKGTVIAADGALGKCLSAGVVPHYVVTLDPHPYRIVRWFGDPDLDSRPADDYFRRQDLDPTHWANEARRNREMLDLVDRHGPQIRCLIATSVDLTVTERCIAAGLELYWWNPIYDDINAPDSISRKVFDLNRAPAMIAGGNVGTAAWVAAHAVLGKKRVALLGFDLGYPPGTPYERTQQYVEMKAVLGDRFTDYYIPVTDPTSGEAWYADPTYYWYRQVFLELVAEADCQTFNCTEGGTVFGDGVTLMPFATFLREHATAGEETVRG